MPPMKMQRIVLAARPQGTPVLSDFRLETVEIAEPGEGELLLETVYLSLDPYMRGRMDDAKSYAEPVAIGAVMEGACVARVLRSNNPRFAVGDHVESRFGWVSHAISNGKGLRKLDPARAPVSTALGVLGMPGITAWAGLNLHGRPQAGETIVVSAATGAVGSLVGQLAKIRGLRVVGVAGGETKCRHAVEELGFDACLDHHSGDASTLRKAIAAECPKGVDIYFENVGGKTLEAVLPLMNVHGRIPVCGMIAWYNAGGLGAGASDGPNLLPLAWRSILVKRLSVRGFIITDHYEHFAEFEEEVSAHVRSGTVKYTESVSQGLASAPQAFLDLLKGSNLGKQLVAVNA
ncbi:MAG: NADP-dependent oxidoreductase [Nitratireductor sp.]|nr:NADP-dependent oxidoreductase [Nitratireductor sp.]